MMIVYDCLEVCDLKAIEPGNDSYRLDLYIRNSDSEKAIKAGQFFNFYTGDSSMLLPRPISVCLVDKGIISFVFRIAGKGTEIFSRLKKGHKIKVMGPLGNGFPLDEERTDLSKARVAIIGGGIGIPPLNKLAVDLKEKYPEIMLEAYFGFRTYEDFITDELIKSLNKAPAIACEDGNRGFKGNIVEYIKNDTEFSPDIIYSCGPVPMLKALIDFAGEKNIPLYVSVEERMACGLGACIGCAVKAKESDEDKFSYKKVCKDGPVFLAENVNL